MKRIVCALALGGPLFGYAAGHYEAGQEKAAICMACHGPTGISANPAWPSLAGQHSSYLMKQLQDFKMGNSRPSPVMAPFVTQLSNQDMEDLAVFYSTQPLPRNSARQPDLTRGEQLYRAGDFSKHITACIACHGPKGTGNAQAGFPVLAGQQIDYTIQQLQAFKDKTRSNDLNSIMRDICARMSTDEMKAVAEYVAQLNSVSK